MAIHNDKPNYDYKQKQSKPVLIPYSAISDLVSWNLMPLDQIRLAIFDSSYTLVRGGFLQTPFPLVVVEHCPTISLPIQNHIALIEKTFTSTHRHCEKLVQKDEEAGRVDDTVDGGNVGGTRDDTVAPSADDHRCGGWLSCKIPVKPRVHVSNDEALSGIMTPPTVTRC